MSFYVERIIIHNRAPFEHIDLEFKDKSISVLTALNGKGKTTILSYIVDAWIELTRKTYSESYTGKEDKYYRVSSPLYDINRNIMSLVYIRFKDGNRNCDFLDLRNNCTLAEYDSTVSIENKIPFHEIQNQLNLKKSFKLINQPYHKEKEVQGIFENNVVTYFPSYRFELPNFLNEKYQENVEHKLEAGYNGYLTNPIEVTSDIRDIANWILDVVLDQEVNKQELKSNDGTMVIIPAPEQQVWMNVKKVLECALISKFPLRNVRFGIGRRNNSGSRLSIMEIVSGGNDRQYCPTVFNLSSGELSIIAIFAEILRQADAMFGMKPLDQFYGIVLIDEVDKHLHIQLQKEVLPLLFNLFPNIQFIVSSHSPFMNMGLAEGALDRTVIYDLDNGGIESSPTTNGVYQKTYELFLSEKNIYAEKYNLLKTQISEITKPLIITEGKTDIIHLRNAQKRLNRTDIDVDYAELPEGKWSDAELKNFLNNIAKIHAGRKIIGMFDRDVPNIVKNIEVNGNSFKTYSPYVYGFCIPIPNGREKYEKISIEFYYSDDVIKKEQNGRRLYFTNEIDVLYNKSANKTVFQKLEIPASDREIQKQIFDEDKMCELTDFIHSKKTFADLLETNESFSNGVDFSEFNKIFDKIDEIINA